MTIGKRIIAGFASVLVITAGLGTFAFSRLDAINDDATRIVNDCLPGAALSGQIESGIRTNYAQALFHVLSTDPAEKDAIEVAMKQQSADLDAAYQKYEGTITLEEDRQLFAALQA